METTAKSHGSGKPRARGAFILRLKGTPANSAPAAPERKMEALVYTANMLYLMSYLVQDMLKLRCLTVVAAMCLVGYFWSQPEPLMTVICWNLFFVGLNILQLTRIVYQRRRLKRQDRAEPAPAPGSGHPRSHKETTKQSGPIAA